MEITTRSGKIIVDPPMLTFIIYNMEPMTVDDGKVAKSKKLVDKLIAV